MKSVSQHFPWLTEDLTHGHIHFIDGRPVARFPKTWERVGPKVSRVLANGKDTAEFQTYKILTWAEYPIVIGEPTEIKGAE